MSISKFYITNNLSILLFTNLLSPLSMKNVCHRFSLHAIAVIELFPIKQQNNR
jgi:hypothetical protein